MKKYILIAVISIFALNFLKNVYLNNRYEKMYVPEGESITFYVVDRFEENDSKLNSSEKWLAKILTFRHGMEAMHHLEYLIVEDSTGHFTNQYYSEKKLGIRNVGLFTWSSLLPYRREANQTYMSEILIDDDNKILHKNGLSESLSKEIVARYTFIGDDLLHVNDFHSLNDSSEVTFSSFYKRPNFFELFYLGLLPI